LNRLPPRVAELQLVVAALPAEAVVPAEGVA
jgi:hypothetical protein